jgi:hypothetical protein
VATMHAGGPGSPLPWRSVPPPRDGRAKQRQRRENLAVTPASSRGTGGLFARPRVRGCARAHLPRGSRLVQRDVVTPANPVDRPLTRGQGRSS